MVMVLILEHYDARQFVKKKCKTSHRRMVDINQLQVIIRKPFYSHPDLRRV